MTAAARPAWATDDWTEPGTSSLAEGGHGRTSDQPAHTALIDAASGMRRRLDVDAAAIVLNGRATLVSAFSVQ
jgi:hypothetical protein